MAELDPIERKLVLTIEEHLAGALKAAGELRSVKDAAKKASTGLEKYSDAVENAAESGNKAAKAWMHMVGSAKLLTQATRRAGAAFIASTGILTKLWDSLVKNNQAFMDLTLSSMNTSNVVSRLQTTVDGVRGSFDRAATSYRDAAEALVAFKSQSIGAAAAIESIPNFEKKFAGVFETLSQNVGQDMAQTLLSEMQGFGLAGFQVEEALTILSKGTKESRSELIGFMSDLDSSQAGMGRWALQAGNAFGGMTEPLSKSVADWKAFWSRLTTMFEDFGTKLFGTIGPKLQPLFDNLESHYPAIIKGVGDAIDWVSSHSEAIVGAFNKVVNTVSGAIKWFSELGSTMKVVVGMGAGALLLPGFAPALLSIAGGAISLSKHLLGLSGILLGPITSSFAGVAKALPGATTAMKVFGAASKFATTTLGPLSIAIGAAYLAFDQFRTWYSQGIEHTWGGKIMDWWFDYEEKLDKVNKKHSKYEQSWFGFGNKEISNIDAEKETYNRKKDMGKLAPDEQTFEQFYKKRQKAMQDSDDRARQKDKERIAAEKKTQVQIGAAADSTAAQQVARAAEVEAKLKEINDSVAASGGLDTFGVGGMESMEKFNQALAKVKSAAAPDALSQAVATLALSNQKWKALEPGLEGASNKAEQLTKLIDTMGPSPAMRQAASEEAAYITSMIPKWQYLADIQVAAAEVKVAEAKNAITREAAEKRLAEEMAKQAKVADMIRVSTDLTAKAGQKAADVQSLRNQAAKTSLQIAQGTLGAAGLSVKAQMKVVDGLQREKEYLKDTHQALLDKIAAGDSSVTTQEAELNVRNKILSITADQVNMLKELRDGYLSAVQAQAFGAGKFEKIIITQEKNLRVALDKGMVKANVLLGTVGEAAKLSNVPIARFSSGGYGLEKMDGGMMTDEDTKKWNENLRINMTDKVSKAAAIAAQKITFESMDHIDASLDNVTQSVDAFDDVIKKSVDAMKRFGATMGNNASSSVIFGEAMRSGQVPAAATPTDRGSEKTGGKYPTAQPEYDNAANVREALRAGSQLSGRGRETEYKLPPAFERLPEQQKKYHLEQQRLFNETFNQQPPGVPVGSGIPMLQAVDVELTHLKESVESTRDAKKVADAKYGEASDERYKLSEKVWDKPTATDHLGAMFSRADRNRNAANQTRGNDAEKLLPGAKDQEAAALAAANAANEEYTKAWAALKKFHREDGYEWQIDKNVSQAQAAFTKQTQPVVNAPAEPTLQTVAAGSVAEATTTQKPRKKPAGIGGGTGGGKAIQLVKDGFSKLVEVAGMLDDLLDDDEQTGFTRPGREGSSNVPSK